MNEVRDNFTRTPSAPVFPFNSNAMDPPKTRTAPKVTARGGMILDNRVRMQAVPTFDGVLDRMRRDKAVVDLPERTLFLGAQMLAIRTC